jgi:hypothetical protein
MHVKTALKLIVILVILQVLVVTIPLEFKPVQAAGWALNGWQYRKKHVLTGASGAGVGYQMMFIVRRASGTDSNNTVYVSDKCKSDFSDIRFTDSNGNVFPYAITYKTTDEAWIWIKPSVDLSVDQTIYIYYGNPNAQSASDSDATFVFAEPCDNSTLNPNRWTIEAGQTSYFTVEPTYRRLSIYYTGSGGTQVRLRSTRMDIAFPSAYRVESWLAKQYDTVITNIGFRFRSNGGSGGTSGYARLDWSIQSGQYAVGDGGVVFATHYYTTSATPYYRRWYGVGHVDESSISAPADTDFYYLFTRNSAGNINILTSAGNNFTKANYEAPNRIYFAVAISGSSTYTGNMHVYAFKIRKYVNPEPQHGAWYPEESASGLASSLTVGVEPSWIPNGFFKLDNETRQVTYSGQISAGSHSLYALDDQIVFNASHIYNFKCWKRNGNVYSYNRNMSFAVELGENVDFKMVYEAYKLEVSTSPSGLVVTFEADGWTLATPATVYRGPGYHTFIAKTDVIYYNSTHMLRFYGWFVNNLYVSPDKTLNLYVMNNMTVKLAYSFQEIPSPPPMVFRAQVVTLGQLAPGTTKNFVITVLFDQNAITITNISFQIKKEWFTLLDPLPLQASRGMENMGTATIQVQLKVPENVEGYYSIPFIVTATTPQETKITTASYITFTVTVTPQVSETTTLTAGGFIETLQRLLGDPILLLLLIALIIWLASYSLKKR